LIANLTHPEEPATFANIDDLVPEAEELSKRELSRLPRPRILKSHQYFDPRLRRVIYLVRDPRDVAISEYHFLRKRRQIDDDLPLEHFVSRFLAGTVSDYGSWAENVGSWVATRQNHPGFLLVRYEDMLADTVGALAKMAAFLNSQPTQERLAQAVQRSSADEMRKLESSAAVHSSVTRSPRQDIRFVREARAGGWRSGLPESSVAEIEHKWGSLMRFLGYQLTIASAASQTNDSLGSLLAGRDR